MRTLEAKFASSEFVGSGPFKLSSGPLPPCRKVQWTGVGLLASVSCRQAIFYGRQRQLRNPSVYVAGALTRTGILLCLGQSAMFSGLNLAFFSVSRLRLEAEAETGNRAAATVLRFRRDSNFVLTTILWGTVSINVLLPLLANSVLFGVVAFLFSTFVITIAGEIGPQAYWRAKRASAPTRLGGRAHYGVERLVSD